MLSFYVRIHRYSLLADEGSAGLRFHERLSDNEKLNTGRNSCVLCSADRFENISVFRFTNTFYAGLEMQDGCDNLIRFMRI